MSGGSPARAFEDAKDAQHVPTPTCGDCSEAEAAGRDLLRALGRRVMYCPVHRVYVEPEETACRHFPDLEGFLTAHTRERG